MSTKHLNMVVHDIGALLMNVSIFVLFYSVDKKLSVMIGGLYLMKTVAGFLYANEVKKQDKEAMEEIERLLNVKDDEDAS